MSRIHFFIAFTCLAVTSVNGEQYKIEWSHQFGTPEGESFGRAGLDDQGNLYIGGGSSGTFGQQHFGLIDAIMVSLDNSGELTWKQQLGTSKGESFSAVHVAENQELYAVGHATGTLFGGYDDIFISSWDLSGNVRWQRQLGSNQREFVNDVATDSLSNLFVAGNTRGVMADENLGYTDAFLTKHDADGNSIWVRQFGSSGLDEASAIDTDGQGNIYVAGYSIEQDSEHAGRSHAAIEKFDSNGDVAWSRTIQDADENDLASAIGVFDDFVYVAGRLWTELPDGSQTDDLYLTKFDLEGNEIWQRVFGSDGTEGVRDLSLDRSGNVFLTGITLGSLAAENAGYVDAFAAKYSASGDLLWTTQFGTDGGDETTSIAVNSAGQVLLSGYTDGSLFSPNLGMHDVFVVKFSPVLELSNYALATIGLIGAAGVIRRRKLR